MIRMNEFLLSFYTAQNRTYQEQKMREWLLTVEKQMNLGGETVLARMERLVRATFALLIIPSA